MATRGAKIGVPATSKVLENKGPNNAKGGRPPGATNLRSRKMLEAIEAEGGLTPLQILVKGAQDLWQEAQDAGQGPNRTALIVEATTAAARAAPYLHPRLNSIDVGGTINVDHKADLRELRAGLIQEIDRESEAQTIDGDAIDVTPTTNGKSK